ncbi:MAG TPA: DUF3078 domain-containing protein [Candidatus Eisenbacteria bacterium]
MSFVNCRFIPVSVARAAAFGLALTAFVSAAAPALGADPIPPGPWMVDLRLGALLSQSSYSNNWAKGDQGSFSWVANMDFDAERQFSVKFNWDNYLRLAYGQTGQQVADPDHPGKNSWEPPNKTTDQILAESTGRFTLGGFVDPFIGIRGESQFEDESNSYGTLNFNPVRLTETAGLARVFKKSAYTEVASRLGLGARQTFGKEFINDGADKRSFSTNDGGVEWFSTAKLPLVDSTRVVYNGRLLVFAPVFYSQSDELERFDEAALALDPNHEEVSDFWRVPDVDWQNEFVARISKVVNVNLLVHMVYDKYDANTNVAGERPVDELAPLVNGAVRKSAQWRQTLALGLTYQIF